MLRTIFRGIGLLSFCLFFTETSAQTTAIQLINARLKNNEAFKKQVIKSITGNTAGNKFIDLAIEAALTIDEVDKVVKQAIDSNEIQYATQQIDISEAPTSRLVPIGVQNYFDEVVNFVITHKTREIEVIPDPPPNASYDYCFPCDSGRVQRYSSDTAKYIKEFFAEYRNMIYKAMQVMRYFVVRQKKGLPFSAEAKARMTEKMEKDVDYLLDALMKKVLMAWTLYKNNATQLSVLNQLVLSINHQFALLGKKLPADFPTIKEIGDQMNTTFTKFYDDAVQRRDYAIILNIKWFISLLRQINILYGEFPVSDKLFQFMQANRFEMIVNAEAELGGEGQSMMAKMTGSNFYRAVPDKDCKLRWHLFEPNEKMMQFTLEKAEANLGAATTYTGTRQWETPPAFMSLGFCDDPPRDTLIMQGFAPKGSETWSMGGQTIPGGFIQGIIMNCFMDEKRIRAEAAVAKVKLEKQQKELMEEYNNAIAGNEHLIKKDPATLTKDERDKLSKVVAASQKIQNMMVSSSIINNMIFKKGLRSNEKTVFESELDGRELFPKNKAILHAKFKVEIVHVEGE